MEKTEKKLPTLDEAELKIVVGGGVTGDPTGSDGVTGAPTGTEIGDPTQTDATR